MKANNSVLKRAVLRWIQNHYQLSAKMTIEQIQALVILQQLDVAQEKIIKKQHMNRISSMIIQF